MSWVLFGFTNPSVVSSGNVTFSLPTRTNDAVGMGDLYIASIGYRGVNTFSSSDWSVINQQSNADLTPSAVDSIPSSMLSYHIRGNTEPSFVLERTGGDVAVGQMLVYRWVGPGRPKLDDHSITLLATANTKAETTALTTTSNNGLIIASAAGALITGTTNPVFYTATDPSIASGNTAVAASTTQPIANTWILRRLVGTSTGADIGLSLAEGVKETAGSTGTIEAPSNTARRYQMIAAAFSAEPEPIEGSSGGRIKLVGQKTAEYNSNANTLTVSLTDLYGGLASSPSKDDVVVVFHSIVHGSGANAAVLSIATSGYHYVSVAADDTNDTSCNFGYKMMGNTPDTDITVNRIPVQNGATIYGGSVLIKVYRGVDKDHPLDVPIIMGAGNNFGIPSVQPITPVTNGAIVVAAGGVGVGATITQQNPGFYSTDLKNRILRYSVPGGWNNIAMMGYKDWEGGEVTFNPWTGGTTSATASWVSGVLALRPAPETAGGGIKVWLGADWEDKPVKVWSGSDWDPKPLKYWDGSAFITTGGGGSGNPAPPAKGNLSLWLEAGRFNSLYVDTSETNIVSGANSPVGVWKDLSGNGFDLAAAADNTTRPVFNYNGGISSVDFNASANTILIRNNSLIYSAGQSSIVFSGVIPVQSLSGSRRIISEAYSGSNNPLYTPLMVDGTTDDIQVFLRNNLNGVTVDFTDLQILDATSNDNVVIVVTDNGSEMRIYMNGTLMNTHSYSRATGVTLDRFALGGIRRADTLQWASFKCYGLMIYDKVLSDSERSAAIDYAQFLAGD